MIWKDKLKVIMSERGFSQKDLAQMLGVSSPTICNMLQSDIRISSLERIADALGVSAAYLLSDEEDESKKDEEEKKEEEYRSTHVHGYLRIADRIIEITSLDELKNAVLACEVNYLK